MKSMANSLSLSAFVLALAGNAAANQTWTGTGPDSEWNNPANWLGSPTGTPNAVPSITEKANIWNAPGPVISSPTATILQLDIGSSSGTSLDIGAGGTLTVNDWFIIGYGAGQTGTFNVNGGTTSLPVSGKDIAIGLNGTGNVAMTSGSITIADDLLFGTGATGVGNMSMSAGSVSVNDDVMIGNVAGSKGYFTMSGGMLTNFDDLFIGDSGTGEMTMTGTVGATITSKTGTGHDLIVGRNAGSNGKLYINSGSITINGIGYIGQTGTGLLDMTGGTLTVAAGPLVIGRNAGSSGEVLLQGGTITITTGGLEFNNLGASLLSHLDITGGTLVLGGDRVGLVNGHIGNGYITTAYGGTELLNVAYDSITGFTTVTAIPESSTLAAFGLLGLISISRRRR
jgi:T5SS/PEP-CTERM-associated repeat protein